MYRGLFAIQAEAMNFRGKELADAYQAKRDVEEKDKVRYYPVHPVHPIHLMPYRGLYFMSCPTHLFCVLIALYFLVIIFSAPCFAGIFLRVIILFGVVI